jgi:hypothetical protein
LLDSSFEGAFYEEHNIVMRFDGNMAVVGLVEAAVASQQGKNVCADANLGNGRQQHATVVQAVLYIILSALEL